MVGEVWEVIEVLLGISAPVAAAAVLAMALRRMLRHAVTLWGARREINPPGSEGASVQFEYRFAIQNLETVPIDDKLFVTLTEEDVSVDTESPQAHSLRHIRVYSGHTKPEFLGTTLDNNFKPARRVTTLRFARMPAQETWTLKVESTAKRVELKLKPRNIDLSKLNPLRPWIALTLSSDSLAVSGSNPVSRGATALPTWTTAVVVAMSGPLLYMGGFGVLWLLPSSIVGPVSLVGTPSWVDGGAVLLLALAGFAWYRWIRRPVYPTIQSYHTFWQEGEDRRLTEHAPSNK